jgi:hypothetical protein
MAIFAATDVSVVINSVDLSDHVTSVSFSNTGADIQTTAFGDVNVTRIGGLQDGAASIEFHSDFAASETYATLNPLINSLTTLAVKADSSATATGNPLHSVSVLVNELPFIDVSVGELATFSVSWPMSGPVTITTS